MRGSLRRRRGSWEWRIHTPDGRETSKAGFETRKAAQEALTKALAAMADQRFVRPDRLTVADYLTETWLPAVKPTIAYTSYVNYRSVVNNHIVPRIGDVPLQKLTPGHVKTMYAELSQSGHRKSTRK